MISHDLTGDIESALVAVRQPVRQYSLKRNPGQPEVCVPNVSGHTPYYQTSFKMKQPTTQTVAEEVRVLLGGEGRRGD